MQADFIAAGLPTTKIVLNCVSVSISKFSFSSQSFLFFVLNYEDSNRHVFDSDRHIKTF